MHRAELRADDGFVQTLAVKWLHPRWSQDPELAGRLRDEARLLALLHHEHVVAVHGLTRIDDRLAILMEAIDGADLARAERERLPPRALAGIGAAVAEALHAAWHTLAPGTEEPLRVVHRDIKPSNIMVTPRGGVKVMDFGVARATFAAREAETRSQQFGTARYMAPERWLEGTAEAASDVFSLGVSLTELLSGQPFERPRLSPAAYAEDLEVAQRGLPEIPALRALLARMMAFDPSERPSAAEVAAALRALEPELPGADLRAWAAAWVPAHQRPRAISGEGTLFAEEASGETFVVTGPLVPPPKAADRHAQGLLTGVVASLLMLAAAVGAWLTLAGPPGTAAPRSAEAPEPPVAAAEVAPSLPADPSVPSPKNTVPAAPIEAPAATDAAPRAPVAASASPRPERVSEPNPERPREATDAPPVEAEPAPAPEPEVATTWVTFVPSQPDLAIQTPAGPASPRRAIALPRGAVSIQVRGIGASWSCTLLVGDSAATWRVDGESQSCVPGT